ncbi:Hypothetical_protein [Hexamita inflata]|uniref:Hypothetical_protein n=1 Tax=Hexamita inflata TaxID=28002 RepID=A0AA86P5V0_9EUKA|nr:Hypothetical protein HINF_LOCUS18745 [Hexamita inflata]
MYYTLDDRCVRQPPGIQAEAPRTNQCVPLNSHFTIVMNIQITNNLLNTTSELIDPHAGGIVGEQQINTNLTIVNIYIGNYTITAIAEQNNSANVTYKTVYSGGLVGISYSILNVQNILISNCNLNSTAQLNIYSGIIGHASVKSNITMMNVTSNTVNIISVCKNTVYSAGIIGYTRFVADLNNITISNNNIVCSASSSNCKITFNYIIGNSVKIINSTSQGVNSINNAVQNNCAILNNIDSLTGC